jgi:hypothetical protein
MLLMNTYFNVCDTVLQKLNNKQCLYSLCLIAMRVYTAWLKKMDSISYIYIS